MPQNTLMAEGEHGGEVGESPQHSRVGVLVPARLLSLSKAQAAHWGKTSKTETSSRAVKAPRQWQRPSAGYAS